jgi:hypothetical protein
MVLGPHLVVGSEMAMVDLEKVISVVAVAVAVAVVVVIGLVRPMVAGTVLTVEVNLVVMEDMVLVVVWGPTGKTPT